MNRSTTGLYIAAASCSGEEILKKKFQRSKYGINQVCSMKIALHFTHITYYHLTSLFLNG